MIENRSADFERKGIPVFYVEEIVLKNKKTENKKVFKKVRGKKNKKVKQEYCI